MKACDNLSEFIELLESEGELLRIGEEISPEIEISKAKVSIVGFPNSSFPIPP